MRFTAVNVFSLNLKTPGLITATPTSSTGSVTHFLHPHTPCWSGNTNQKTQDTQTVISPIQQFPCFHCLPGPAGAYLSPVIFPLYSKTTSSNTSFTGLPFPVHFVPFCQRMLVIYYIYSYHENRISVTGAGLWPGPEVENWLFPLSHSVKHTQMQPPVRHSRLKQPQCFL